MTDSLVITTYESRIFVAVNYSVEQQHWYSGIVCLGYNICERIGVMRRNNKNIHFLVDEILYVFNLLVVVVFCTAQFHCCTFLQQQFPEHLIVLFLSPKTAATLRHTNAIFMRIFVTA